MKMNHIAITILVLLLVHACENEEDNCHKTITFTNRTMDTLYVIANSDYPDTLAFQSQPDPLLDPNFTKVLPEESNSQALWRRDCIELAFKDLIPSDTLMVYVFDAQILESIPWDTVKSQYPVLKRHDLSLEDLQQLNWEIIYP